PPAPGRRDIEDFAGAAGTFYRGRRVGNFGDVAIFSGDPSKPFTCVQGGVAVTNDERLAARRAALGHGAAVHDDATVANRLGNVALNYAPHKDPQRYLKAELTWWRHGG